MDAARLPTVLPGDQAGWLDGTGPPSGEVGTTVLVGHVVFGGKPAVFATLAATPPGDIATIHQGGFDARYRIDSIASYRKGDLPQWLWSPRPVRTLVLITCGGPIEPATGLRTLNVVAAADLIDAA